MRGPDCSASQCVLDSKNSGFPARLCCIRMATSNQVYEIVSSAHPAVVSGRKSEEEEISGGLTLIAR